MTGRRISAAQALRSAALVAKLRAGARSKRLAPGLYRVDAAGIASRYDGAIGQPADLLVSVERGGAILLLDEADALLTRRSEVKDAHDRFATIDRH